VKNFLRAAAKAMVFSALAALALWYGLVFLLVNRVD
jgi:hypothetical protein